MAIASAHPLQNQVTGRVIQPGDPDYEQVRRGWNLTINHHPALILVADHAQDIAAGIRFARGAGLGVAVQLTGHGIHVPADGSLLIITSRLNDVFVDAGASRARVEAGAVWQQVIDKAAPHGLAPLLGTSPQVGVVGYTLGGGIGWMARRYGLAADSVRAIEIVTPDGVLRRASATENGDLFWGLRGGGGNFGVVTALEFDLYPVATIYGGGLVYPAEAVGEALRLFRDWTQTLPDGMTSSLAIMKFPDLPFLPDATRGKTLAILRAVYTGEAADGEKLIQKWIDWRAPVSNTFREMPFAEIASVSNDPVDPSPTHYSNEMIDELSDAAIDIIVRHATNRETPLVVTELRHAGGAIARTAADFNAIGNRDAQYYLQMAGVVFTPELYTPMNAAIEQYKRDLRPHLRGGIYLNFNKGDMAQVEQAYLPESYMRLLDLKVKFDPQNLFRFSYQLVK